MVDDLKPFEGMKLPEGIKIGNTAFQTGVPVSTVLLYARQLRVWLDEELRKSRNLEARISQQSAVIDELRLRLGE